MLENFKKKAYSFTDFFRRLDFWCSIITLSAPIIGIVLKVIDYINFPNIMLLSGFIPFFLWLYFHSKAKNTNQSDVEAPQAEEVKDVPPETLPEEILPQYISLQEAASLLAEETQFSTEKLQWVARFPGGFSMQDTFWKRDNPDKVHKETLDEGTTIPLIHLCLHICKNMNVEIYGTRPSFSEPTPIPYEDIKYFDADYKKLYSHIARESTNLIYNDVKIVESDLIAAIDQTDFDALIADMNR